MNKRATALVIAGPSGGGKTTVMNELIKSDVGFSLVRSATTRQRRNDGNDTEYIYLSRDEFLALCGSGKMLEFTEYGGNLYGTPHSEIERIVKEGKIPLLILDINGVRSLRRAKLDFDVYAVYLYAPLTVLSQRLTSRYFVGGTLSDSYTVRMDSNLSDYRASDEWIELFDAVIPNLSLDEVKAVLLSSFGQGAHAMDEGIVDKIKSDADAFSRKI